MIWQDSFQQSAGEEGKLHWVRQLGGVMNIDSDLIFLSRNLSRISRREIGQSSLRGRQGWEKGLLVWFCFIFRWKKLSIFIIWERKLEEREMSMSRRERIINRVEVLKRYQGASSALNNLLVYCLANFPQINLKTHSRYPFSIHLCGPGPLTSSCFAFTFLTSCCIHLTFYFAS